MTFEEAQATFAALLQEGVDFVVVGAMAMAAQGLPRATEDLDLFVAPRRESLEALKRALIGLFRDPTLEELVPDERMGDYPAIEYVPPGAGYSLDLLTRLGEAFSWEDLEAGSQELRLGGMVVRVASPEMLYRMK